VLVGGRPATRRQTVFVCASGEPFRVSFTGKDIEIAERIATSEDADDLVSAVDALKLLVKPAGEAKRPDNASYRSTQSRAQEVAETQRNDDRNWSPDSTQIWR
jgi:hypothetical protein